MGETRHQTGTRGALGVTWKEGSDSTCKGSMMGASSGDPNGSHAGVSHTPGVWAGPGRYFEPVQCDKGDGMLLSWSWSIVSEPALVWGDDSPSLALKSVDQTPQPGAPDHGPRTKSDPHAVTASEHVLERS